MLIEFEVSICINTKPACRKHRICFYYSFLSLREFVLLVYFQNKIVNLNMYLNSEYRNEITKGRFFENLLAFPTLVKRYVGVLYR